MLTDFLAISCAFKKTITKKFSTNLIFKFTSKVFMNKLIYNMINCIFLSGKHIINLHV